MNANAEDSESLLKSRPAPDFTLPMPEGDFLSLQELRGQKVLLVFLRHFA